jgi:MFS transporter, FHS family, glucose/mannose:H+ symporter
LIDDAGRRTAPSRPREIGTVYAVGLFQGLALVAFPASSSVLTGAADYDLSSSQYGLLFVPQVLMAILGSLALPELSHRIRMKRLFGIGIAAGVASMAVFVASVPVRGEPVAFPMLLVATAFLGLGFGLTLSCLSTFAGGFMPARREVALTALNVLLGLGAALSPLLVAFFTDVAEWWYLPVLTGVGLLALLAICLPQRLTVDTGPSRATRVRIPPVFWMFAGVLVAYGVCETLFGNWGPTLLRDGGTAPTTANYALAAFWAAVTVGRLLISIVPKRIPSTAIYRGLPWGIAGTLLLVAAVSDNTNGIVIFALAGLACSGFFPMTIGYGETTFPELVTTAAGWLIASYQLGYGIAAFGAGVLEHSVSLSVIFAVVAFLAVAMALSATRICARRAARRTGVDVRGSRPD